MCQPNLQVQRISVQFSRGARCLVPQQNVTKLTAIATPLLSKTEDLAWEGSPCGIG